MASPDIWEAMRRGARKTAKKARTAAGLFTKLRYHYGWHYQHSRVQPNVALFESFHGKTVSDSPLHMLLEFLGDPRSEGFDIYYSTSEANLAAHAALAEKLGLAPRVKLVPIESRKYAELLATAGYLVNNSSFPAYFTRRQEQRYVQTWHGTPLKTLGKQMRLGVESMYNVQHNFLQASMLTFPNEFTRHVMMRDYNLEQLYTGTVAMLGYPRNRVFFDEKAAREVKDYYGLHGYETFAYMPTWRGSNNYTVNVDEYRNEVMRYLAKIDAAMRDDQMLFVNFHSMVADQMGELEFDHVFPFPKSRDNYDFLAAMDVLITDYSSVCFDFSLTRRPVIMFAYDEEAYLADRGMYMGVEDLPFQVVRDIDELTRSIATGSFRGFSYAGGNYDKEFLSYDSPDNAKHAVDLLLEGSAEGVPIIDYSSNRQRKWQTFEPCRQATVDDIQTACEAADPEADIVVFLRSRFNAAKSLALHDYQGDPFNYVFITKAYNCTGAEQFLMTRSERMRMRVLARERDRVFPGLDVPDSPRCNVYAGKVGTSYLYSDAELPQIPASVEYGPEGELVVAVDSAGATGVGAETLVKLVLVRKRTIIETEPLTAREARTGRMEKALMRAMRRCKLEQQDSIRVFLEALDGNGSSVPMEAALIPAGSVPKEGCNYEAYRPLAVDVTGPYGEDLAILPYLDKRGKLRLRATEPAGALSWFMAADLQSLRNEDGMVVMRLTLQEGLFMVEDLVLRLRHKIDQVEVHLPYDLTARDGMLTMESRFDPADFDLREVYWDAFVIVRFFGLRADVPVRMSRGQIRSLKIGNQQWRLGDKVLFTHIGGRSLLAFVYRDYYPKLDTYALRLWEFAALAAYRVLRPYWDSRGIWLVYEKFCSLAQDNAFYFFEYCMSLPPEQRRRVFYVIDKSKPDYANVAPYGSQVLDFMSVRHILYALAARIYVASDSRTHLYVWRHKPSFVRTRMSKHDIFFLQHGVTAMKQVAHLFGKNGSSPMTYFLTTSRREQDIVVQNFDYNPQEAPVLGFSRWDVLRDRACAEEPVILLMPTWRPWLEEQSDEVFVASEYFHRYSSLIASETLADVLERHNATLRFFIHPKLSEQLDNFEPPSDRIQMVPQGSEPLNEVMMRASMVVTDYSSVCWDMLYMDKPVVFYQFDQQLYEDVVGSYVDLNADLPGEVCLTEEQAVAAIERCAERGFKLTEDEAQKAKGWFAVRDTDNRKRTYEFIKARGY